MIRGVRIQGDAIFTAELDVPEHWEDTEGALILSGSVVDAIATLWVDGDDLGRRHAEFTPLLGAFVFSWLDEEDAIQLAYWKEDPAIVSAFARDVRLTYWFHECPLNLSAVLYEQVGSDVKAVPSGSEWQAAGA